MGTDPGNGRDSGSARTGSRELFFFLPFMFSMPAGEPGMGPSISLHGCAKRGNCVPQRGGSLIRVGSRWKDDKLRWLLLQ